MPMLMLMLVLILALVLLLALDRTVRARSDLPLLREGTRCSMALNRAERARSDLPFYGQGLDAWFGTCITTRTCTRTNTCTNTNTSTSTNTNNNVNANAVLIPLGSHGQNLARRTTTTNTNMKINNNHFIDNVMNTINKTNTNINMCAVLVASRSGTSETSLSAPGLVRLAPSAPCLGDSHRKLRR